MQVLPADIKQFPRVTATEEILENLEEEKLKEARKFSMNRYSSVKRQLDDTLKPCKIQKKKKELSESSSSAVNIEQLTDSDDENIFPELEDENDLSTRLC
ncbi:hypothetical protein HHI36_010185 [Cryptolaemus montrouzieri]|uniref:Uncharacterized protein n=1 Tax=Cryptolaemus montrouzieri TaxID=559131 RepID=A0ABD2MHY0_9CUCU